MFQFIEFVSGKTAVYLLYALTRIRSIARNAGKSREELLKHAQENPLNLEHEAELRLAKMLLRFAEVSSITNSITNVMRHKLYIFHGDIN